MTARAVVEQYFEKLSNRTDWQSSFSDDARFVSHASPIKEAKGKAAFIMATNRFYSSIGSVEVRQLLVDGDFVVAFTRYQVRPPNGAPTFSSDVAELFHVKNGRIAALEIYFDTAPYPR